MAIILTDQELINAKRDIEDIGKAVNQKEVVYPRYGDSFKSLPMAMAELEAAVEAAAAAGAGENGWTDLLIQTADGSTQRAKNTSLQSQIDGKASAEYLDVALAEQTQTVNTALSQLSTAATKFYPTLAAANADIANIAVDQPVTVGEKANGGLWYKATSGATSLTKSPYDPVELGKNYVSNTGEASVVGLAMSNINYVTATRTLEFKNTLYVVSGTSRYQLTTPQSVALPENTPYRIEYNVSTGLISAVAYSQARTEGSLVVGFSTASATTLKTLDFGFTVDGVVQNPPHRGELITNAATRINFNDATAQLIFSGSIRLKTPYLTTNLDHLTTEQKIIAYPAAAGTYFLQYDLTKKVFSFRLNSVAQPLNTADVGMVVFANNSVTAIKGIDTYTSSLADAYPPQKGELLSDNPSWIAFDTVNSLLTISPSVRVKSPLYTASDRPSIVTVSIPTVISIYQLMYNIETGVFSFVLSGTVQANSTIALATVYVGSTGLKVTGITNYTLNGVAVTAGESSEYGELYNLVASRISFDTTAKTLTITAAVRVLSAGFTYLPSSAVVVPFPTTAGAYSLVFNKVTKMYSFKTRANVAENHDIVLDYIDFAATTFFPTVRRIESYVIDGVTLGKYSDLKVAYTGELIASSGALNFDFRNNKITVAPLRLSSSGTTFILSSHEIEIIGTPQGWKKLLYNFGTRTFSMKEITNIALDEMQEIIVAYFNPGQKAVHGVANYSINGKEVKGFHEPIQNADFRIPYGDVTSTYNGRTLPELNTLYTSIGTNLDAFYALYDDLATTYPTYVEKTTLGSDKDGNPIHQYRFNAPEVPTVASASKKPKIIILSNIHGFEKAVTYVLYQSLKEICEQWQNNESLEALRWGANLIVVPVINPSGFIGSPRTNSNGVDLERNFPAGWLQGTPGSQTYGGAAPLSEPEAVIVDNLISSNTDAIHFMSCHSFSAMSSETFPNGVWAWLPLATDFGINLAKSLIMKNSIQSKKLYPFIDSEYVGYTDKALPGGSSSYHAAHYYGVQGGTFEICGKMYWEPGQPYLSEAVVTCGSNLIINWLLMNIKYATELYNSRVNI